MIRTFGAGTLVSVANLYETKLRCTAVSLCDNQYSKLPVGLWRLRRLTGAGSHAEGLCESGQQPTAGTE